MVVRSVVAVKLAGTLALVALACGACAGRPSQGMLIPLANAGENNARVTVLAATTRRPSTTDEAKCSTANAPKASPMPRSAFRSRRTPRAKIGKIQWPASTAG